MYGISQTPAITINGQIYRGDFDGYDFFKAICASFQPKNRPAECKEDFDIQQELGHAEYEFIRHHHRRKLYTMVALITLTFFIVLYCCKKIQKRRMQTQMAEAVSQNVGKYFELQGKEDEADVSTRA